MYRIKSFSLIELLIVIFIISLIFSLSNFNVKEKNKKEISFIEYLININKKEDIYFYCKNIENKSQCFYIEDKKIKKSDYFFNFTIKEYFIDNTLKLVEKKYQNDISFSLIIRKNQKFIKKIIKMDENFVVLDSFNLVEKKYKKEENLIEDYYYINESSLY